MLVILLERVPKSLRGKLSRWMIEPMIGVFLGNPSARVRDELIKKIRENLKDGGCILIWDYPCPQGYKYETIGTTSRTLEDFDGISLVRMAEKGKMVAKTKKG